jgi:hypothetical protein
MEETNGSTPTAMPEPAEAQLKKTPGVFAQVLQRNNKQIRNDRALTIVKNARLTYKRNLEDLEAARDQIQMERENLLDLSPTDAKSLVLASDFNAQDFVNRDIGLGVKLRELEIRLEIARRQYNYLFGGE